MEAEIATLRICPMCHGRGRLEHRGHQHTEMVVQATFDDPPWPKEDVFVFGPLAGTCFGTAWGTVTDGYLAILGSGRGYLFQADGPLHIDYVAEKLGLPTESLARQTAVIIAEATGREVIP